MLKWMRKKKKRASWQEVIVDYLGGLCIWCGTDKKLHLHHSLPLSRGGRNVMSNLELVCSKCHKALHKQISKIMPLVRISKNEKRCTGCGEVHTRLKNVYCWVCKPPKRIDKHRNVKKEAQEEVTDPLSQTLRKTSQIRGQRAR